MPFFIYKPWRIISYILHGQIQNSEKKYKEFLFKS